MAKKRKKKNNNNIIIAVLVAVIVILVAVFIGPKVVHECADCGETIIGAGYEPGKLVEMLDDSEEEMIICEACAEEQHALELAIGNKTLEDFEREIF